MSLLFFIIVIIDRRTIYVIIIVRRTRHVDNVTVLNTQNFHDIVRALAFSPLALISPYTNEKILCGAGDEPAQRRAGNSAIPRFEKLPGALRHSHCTGRSGREGGKKGRREGGRRQ